jgi:hypothetical protein
LGPNEIELHDEVNLWNYFEIRKSGKYHFECEVRLQTMKNDFILKGLLLPKAAIDVDVALPQLDEKR